MNRTATAALLAGLVAVTGCRSQQEEPAANSSQPQQARRQAQAPAPAVELSGVWERNDGAIFRLVESRGALLGYRGDDSYFGCRVSLAVDAASLTGHATFTRRRDEGAPLATEWKLSVRPDGTLAGRVEAVDVDESDAEIGRAWIEHTFVKQGPLGDGEGRALAKAMQAHLKVDRRLAKGNVIGASDALTLAKFAFKRDDPERAAIDRRLVALSARKRAIEVASAGAKAAFERGEALMLEGEFQGAIAAFQQVLTVWTEHRASQACIDLSTLALRAEDMSEPAEVAALAREVRERVTVIRSVEAVLPKEVKPRAYEIAAGLYLKAARELEGDPTHVFDAAVCFYYADRLQEARALLGALVKTTPEATSRKGDTALAMSEALDEAITLQPGYHHLYQRKNKLAAKHGLSDRRFLRVEAAFKRERSKYRSAARPFRDYWDR